MPSRPALLLAVAVAVVAAGAGLVVRRVEHPRTCPAVEDKAAAPTTDHRAPPGGGATALGIGGDRSCAVVKDGAVWCWGDGRLGRGLLGQRGSAGTPRTLADSVTEAGGTLLHLSHDASGYGCGVFTSSVRCWDLATPTIAPPAPPAGRFDAVWTGSHSACARASSGDVSCWGTGRPWREPGEVFAPAAVRGLVGADEVGICEGEICARRGTSVVCTPRADLEDLLRGAQGAGTIDVNATRLACCDRLEWAHPRTCAVTTAREVVCWGAAEQAGAGPVNLGPALASVGAETSAVCSPGRGDTAPGVVRTIVAAGVTCTVDAAGAVACSGIPAGDGVEIDMARLHPLPGVLGAVDALVDPYEWCVAASSGAWTCWPRLREHVPRAPVVSDASTGTFPVLDAAPSPAGVPGIAGATALAQNRFAFCHSDADGQTRCLSRHGGGPGEELVLSGVRKLAMGIGHACAIDDHDRLSCWGANESGQSSGGKGAARVDAPVAVMGDVVDVGVGLGHTCAVKRDGSVVCFGDNRSGQLGDRSITPAGAPATVAGLPEPAVHIAVGFDHACVSTGQGHVLCWGADTKDAESPSAAALRPHPVEGLSLPVKDIAAGGDRTCALLANASVMCWGRGTWQEPGEDGAPRAVAGTEASVEIGMGDNHACVRDAGGQVRCWGWNQQGQLGATLTTRRIETGPPGGCPVAVYTTDEHAQRAVDVEW